MLNSWACCPVGVACLRINDRHAGKKSNSRQFDSYGAPYGQSDVVGCLLDCDSGTIAFSKNGEDLGLAFQIPGKLQGTALYPAICLKNAELVVNFGEETFKFGPPKGFVGMAKAPQEWVQSGESAPECIITSAGLAVLLSVSCEP